MSTTTQGIDIVIGAKTQQATAAMGILNGFVQGIGMAVANYAGRAARALGEMTGQALHTSDEMGKLAQKAGTTTEKFSAVAYAAKLSDVSLESLVVGFKGLSSWMEKNGQVGRDVVDVMVEQAGVFEGMADGAAKTNLAMDLFGRSALDLIPLLNQGTDALRDQMEEAKALGVVISGDTAKAAETFNDRITTMKTRFQGVFLQLAQKLLPSLLELSDVFLATLEKGAPFLDFLEEGAWLMSKAAGMAGWFASKWAFVTTAMGSLWGSLYSGVPYVEAVNQAMQDGADAAADFEASVKKYRDEREKANKADAAAAVETPKLAGEYENLTMRLKQLQGLSDGATGEKLAAGLRMQLEVLDQLEKAAGEATQVLGDGALVYTEEGLKAAEKLLDIERERERVLRDLAGLSFSGRLQQNIEAMGTSMQRLADFTSNFVTGAMQGLAGAITDVIMGTKSAGEAFAAFGLSLLTNFIASVLEMILIAEVAIPILTALGVLSGGATVGSGLAVTTSALAAGAAAAAGAARGYAGGGLVEGAGTATSDSILSRLSTGEFVMNADATAAIGPDNLAEANRTGQLPSSGGQAPVHVNVALFGVESAAQRWAESQEGRTTIASLVREEVGKML
ncbi:MAG: hypothetical protein U1G08_17930 [Verrucomicrobiota bacterium]